jgi:hypothetical protein
MPGLSAFRRVASFVVTVLALSACSRRDVVEVKLRDGSRADALVFEFVRSDGELDVPTGAFNVRRCGTVDMVWDVVAYAPSANRPEPPELPGIRYGERPAGMAEWTKPTTLGAGCYEARLETRNADLPSRGIQFEVLADGSVR